MQYNSRYVSEGRNNLNKGGIVWLNGSFELFDKVSTGLAYGHSTSNDQDYDELNVSLTYADSFAEVDWYFSLTRFEFFKDSENDNEIGVGVSYNGFGVVRVFGDAYYSTEANGTFVELGVDRLFNLVENFDLTPYAKAGFDFDYASQQHDGHSHIAVGAQLDYNYSADLSLFLILEHVDGGNDVSRDLGNAENETWLGFGLVTSF